MKTSRTKSHLLPKKIQFIVFLSIFPDSRIDSRFWPKLAVKRNKWVKHRFFHFLNMFFGQDLGCPNSGQNKQKSKFSEKISTTQKTRLHPQKLTCALKWGHVERNVIFQPLFCRGYASFRGVNFLNTEVMMEITSVSCDTKGLVALSDEVRNSSEKNQELKREKLMGCDLFLWKSNHFDKTTTHHKGR